MAAKIIPLWVAIAVSAGMTAVSVGLSYALRKTPKIGDADPNEHASNIVDTDAFVPVLAGKALSPVFIVFADTNPDNVNELHLVGVFSHGEIEGVERVYFDNMQIVAKKTAGQFRVIGEYDDYVDINVRRGAASDINRPYEYCVKTFKKWTSKHTSGMIASFYMVVRFNQDLFMSVPAVFILGKGKKIYDVRNGQTVWSDNPVLWTLHYLTDPMYGKGLNIDTEIDTASFIAEANYCDETLDFPKALSPAKIEPRLGKKSENPLETGTYYFKYSYCYGSTIGSENEGYSLYESNLSPSVQVVVTSSYGEVALDNIANSPESEVTLKRIYRTVKNAGSGSAYYLVKEIDYNATTTTRKSNAIGQAFDNSVWGTGGLDAPVAAATASFVDYSDSGLQTQKKYRYKCSFVVNPGGGEGETLPSPASKVIKTTSSSDAVKLPTPDVKDDGVTHVRWYRTEGFSSGGKTNSEYYKVADVPIGTSEYIDKLSDAQLDHAKAPVTTSTFYASLKRFTCNGVLDTGGDQDGNLEKLLSSCRGRLYNVGGVYKIFIPKIAVPETFELNEDNIIGDWSFRILGMDKRPNVVKATFINPDAEWKSDTVLWPKSDKDNLYLKDDNNFKKVLDIDLPFTTDKRVAEMICQTIRKEARNNIQVELNAMESARILKCGSLVKVTHSLPGWDKKKFWVDGMGIFPDRTVRLVLVEYNEDDYIFETLTEDTLPGADTDLGDPFEPPDEVTNVVIREELFNDKTSISWRLKVTYTNPTSAFWTHSEVYLKAGNDTSYAYYTKIDRSSNGVFYVYPAEALTTYYLKVLSVSILGAKKKIADPDNTVWQHTVVPPYPPDPTGLQILNRGNNDNVFGSSFVFAWTKVSAYGDGTADTSYAQGRPEFLQEKIRYLVEIYYAGIPDNVRVGRTRKRANSMVAHSQIVENSRFIYPVEQNIEDSRLIWEDHTYDDKYDDYYGVPQRTIKCRVWTINAWMYKSRNYAEITVTNQAPDMKNRLGVAITPTAYREKSSLEFTWPHPWKEYDISRFIGILALDNGLTVQIASKTIASAITVFDTDEDLNGVEYEMKFRSLDPKVTYYFAVLPVDVYGKGERSQVVSNNPAITHDDILDKITPPIQIGAPTLEVLKNNAGKIKWTILNAIDIKQYLVDWRGCENLSASQAPSDDEVSQGYLDADNSKKVLGGHLNIPGDKAYAIVKGLKAGFKYFARVRAENSSEQLGVWSNYATHVSAVSGEPAEVADNSITTAKLVNAAVTVAKQSWDAIHTLLHNSGAGVYLKDNADKIRFAFRVVNGGAPDIAIAKAGYDAITDIADMNKTIFTSRAKGYLSYVDSGSTSITFDEAASTPTDTELAQDEQISLNIGENIVRGVLAFANFSVGGRDYMLPLNGFQDFTTAGKVLQFFFAYDSTDATHLLKARRWIKNNSGGNWTVPQLTIKINWYLLGETLLKS